MIGTGKRPTDLMRRKLTRTAPHLFALGLALTGMLHSMALARAGQVPQELANVGITEHLGNRISIEDLAFNDESGRQVRLAEYFKRGRPVLLTLVYFECPNLCNLLLNGLVQSLKGLAWTPGHEFEMVTVSINPKETSTLARDKKLKYIESYGRPASAHGWHFLTGDESKIQQLANEVGFQYHYDKTEKQYAHTAAIFLLAPDGKISRYLYGISFPLKDLRLGLLEASNGTIGTVTDRILLFCFHYDLQSRGYSLFGYRLMQVACLVLVLVLGTFLLLYWRREVKRAT